MFRRPPGQTTRCRYTLKGKETDYNPYVGKMKDTCLSLTVNALTVQKGSCSNPKLPKPYTRYPKPYTLNPTPYTLNPTS